MKQVTWSSQIDLGYNCTRLCFVINYTESFEGIVPKFIIGDLMSNFDDIKPYRNSVRFWRNIKDTRNKLKKAKKKGGSKVPYIYEGEQLVYKEPLTVEDIYNSIKTV